MSSTTRGAARGAAAEEAPVVSDAAADAGGVQRVPRVVDVANASTPEFVPSQGQGQGLPKTDAMYSAGRTKFREFIKSRPVEDRIEAYWFNFLDGDGKIRDGTFRMFAEWLDEQPKMSESAFKTAALKWTQHNLVLQHRARYLPTSHLGAYVTTLPGVATIWEKYKVGRASQVRVEFVDLQQQTESAITADQMISSMRLLMSDAPLTCSDGTTVTPLMKANARFEMRASHQQSGRSDDMRSETLAFSFAKTHPLLGPEGEGKSLTVFSNQGKVNTSGRVEYVGSIHHNNPLLCVIAAKGFMYALRFCRLGETPPDFLDYKDLFTRPVLRATSNYKAVEHYNTSLRSFNAVYAATGVKCFKKLHQGRAQGQQESFDRGVGIVDIALMARYIHKAQTQSYITGVPISVMLDRAGSDHTFPQGHSPVWASVPVDDTLLGQLAPWFLEAEARVNAAWESAPDAATCMDQRLYSARGSCAAMRLCLVSLLQAAAARPLDARGSLLVNEEPLYRQLDNEVFRLLPVFKSLEFADLHARVNAAEAAAFEAGTWDRGLSISSPVTQRIDAVVRQHTAPIVQIQRQIKTQLTLVGAAQRELTTQSPADAPQSPAGAPAPAARGQDPGLQEAPPNTTPPAPHQRHPQQAPDSEASSPAKKPRTSRSSYANAGQYVQSDELRTVRDLYGEWDVGIGGQAAVRDLEAGFPANAWRKYKGGADTFCRRRPLYEYIDKRPDREVAIQELQARLDAFPKKGKSKLPNVAGFLRGLAKTHPASKKVRGRAASGP